MGFTRAVGLIPGPARELDLASFPTIDAVFLTHEHQGHVDLPSLNLFDRRVPIHCSARSSTALVSALREMGFVVHRMRPGDEIVAGSLHALTADQNDARIEEWDVLPYLVRDVGGDGSFFTSVDMASPPRSMVGRCFARCCRWTSSSSTSPRGPWCSKMSQDAIGLGRHRIFCQDLSIDCGMNQAIFTYVHPLRFPDRFSAFYRRLIDELPATAPVVRARDW